MPASLKAADDMTAAIYARFSSDLQTEKSIEDQVARCREIAVQNGATFAEVYSDEALSGASMANRPGLQRLLQRLQSGHLSMIITESLDRLSRDQADLAMIYRHTKITETRLITAADGEISDGAQGIFQVGMRAIFGAMYLADLSDKTRRGQKGVARDRRIPGGLCYGYRKVEGEKRGLREIVPEEAEIVRRIYEEFATGRSPREIVKRLNAEGVPGPRGNTWGISAVLGNPKRLNGVLSNPLYNGELVFNRQRKVKNPETGKARMVPNPESEWMREPMDHLRIVPEELFNRVAKMRADAAGTRPEYQRRGKRVLSGMVKCGVCGGSYRAVAQKRYGCANHRDRGTCDNTRTILVHELENRVFQGLRKHVLAPDAVEYAVQCYRERMDELEGDKLKRRTKLEKDAAQCRSTIDLAQGYLAKGEMPPDWLFQGATKAEHKLKALEEELSDLGDNSVVQLHPNAAKVFRALITDLNHCLEAGDDYESRTDAVNAVRALLSNVIVTPGEKRGEVHVDLEGDLAALLEYQESGQIAVTLGAGAGFEPATFRL